MEEEMRGPEGGGVRGWVGGGGVFVVLRGGGRLRCRIVGCLVTHEGERERKLQCRRTFHFCRVYTE